MSFDIDVMIFVGFLLINLVFGLFCSKGIKNIKSYAIGEGNFSTATIVSTLVATWVSGEFFVTIATETYNAGLIFIFVVLADILSFFLTGVLFAPRMAEFLGKLSIADAMGDLYGKNVRVITAIAGFITVSGIIAIQLQIAGVLFKYALGIPTVYGILTLGVIITLYSSLGGIKSVAFTDVMQFLSFGIIIPIIAYFLFSNADSNRIINTLTTNPSFDYTTVLTFNNPEIYYYISLFLWLFIPPFSPAFFQRIAMSKDVKQAGNTFVIASILGFFIAAMVCLIGIIMLSIYPNIEGDKLLETMLLDYGWIIGFKGLILAGIMAMVMSTIDSYINSSSILLVHDLWKSFNIGFIKNELLATRNCSMLIGLVSMMFAMYGGNFFELILWTSTFYMPIVTVPFIMSIFGFRSSSKSVLIGMSAGFVTVVIWESFLKIQMGNVGGLIPGMIANLIFLIGSHYLLKQPGGWIKRASNADSSTMLKKNSIFQEIFSKKISLNLMEILKKNTPQNEGLTSLFGLFVMVSMFVSIIVMPKTSQMQYGFLINMLYPVTLSASTILISYPLWASKWKETNLITICWNIIIFLVLICFSFLMVLISNFSEVQLILFMCNILIISSLINWRWSLLYLAFGVCITLLIYEMYLFPPDMQSELYALKFKITYLLLLVGGILIMFLKPKQQHEAATEQKAEYFEKKTHFLKSQNECAKREIDNLAQGIDFLEKQFTQKSGQLQAKEVYLRDQLKLMRGEVAKLQELKNEFVRNVPHEINTPMTAVLSLSEVLYSCYDSSDADTIKGALKAIINGGDRLKNYVNNIANLSKLSSLSYDLNKKELDLGQLIKERTVLYKKLFTDDDNKQEFKFDIEKNVMVYCDEYYMTQAIDNLISNANTYGEGKPIEISLHKKEDGNIEFTITDKGIGIPQGELISIFDKFTVSSKTRSPAGGRGVGLALCQKIIEIHGGTISAESDGKNGSTFYFIIPTAA